MTASETQEMLTAIRHEEIAPIVYTTLYYGLRKSEVLGLKWSAVDFQNNTISIEFTVVKNKSIIEKASTKIESSCRKYELIPEIKTLLQQLKIEQETNRINNPLYCQNDYVFKHADGTPFRPDCLTRSFQRALARAGFPNTRIIHGFQVGQRELLKNHLPNPKSDFCDLNNRKSPVAPSQKGIVSLSKKRA